MASPERVNERVSISEMYEVIALIPCRDGEKTIEQTVRSILNQSVKTFVSVADDASIDKTADIVKNLIKTGRVGYVRYPRREMKDYARVPILLSMALKISPPARYYMISGDDSIYPPNYCEDLIRFMKKDGVELCSGFIGRYDSARQPSGSGRLVASDLFKIITPFPKSIGWESHMIYKTLSLRRKIAVYPVEFKHSRKYSLKSTWTFGQSAYVNGIPLIFTLLRAVKNIISRDLGLINSLSILLGHIEYLIRGVDKLDTAPFTRRMHLQKICRIFINIFRRT